MSDHLAAKASRPKRKKHLWPYLVALVIVLAWACLTLPAFVHGIAPYATDAGTASGRVYFYFATRCFIQALVVWLLVSAPFIKWQGPHPGFFFILLAGAIAPCVAVLHQGQARAGLYHYGDSRMQSGLAEAKSSALTTIRFGPQADSDVDVQARAVGATGQVGQAWRQLIDGVAADFGGYETKLAALGVQKVDPAKLGSAQSVAEVQAKLAQARKLIDSYQGRSAGRFTTYQAAIGRIGTAANAQSKALADKALSLKSYADALWAKKHAILAEEDAMIGLLTRAHGGASGQSGRAFRSHQAKLRELVGEAQQKQFDMQQYASELSGQIAAAAGETQDDDQDQ